MVKTKHLHCLRSRGTRTAYTSPKLRFLAFCFGEVARQTNSNDQRLSAGLSNAGTEYIRSSTYGVPPRLLRNALQQARAERQTGACDGFLARRSTSPHLVPAASPSLSRSTPRPCGPFQSRPPVSAAQQNCNMGFIRGRRGRRSHAAAGVSGCKTCLGLLLDDV